MMFSVHITTLTWHRLVSRTPLPGPVPWYWDVGDPVCTGTRRGPSCVRQQPPDLRRNVAPSSRITAFVDPGDEKTSLQSYLEHFPDDRANKRLWDTVWDDQDRIYDWNKHLDAIFDYLCAVGKENRPAREHARIRQLSSAFLGLPIFNVEQSTYDCSRLAGI